MQKNIKRSQLRFTKRILVKISLNLNQSFLDIFSNRGVHLWLALSLKERQLRLMGIVVFRAITSIIQETHV